VSGVEFLNAEEDGEGQDEGDGELGCGLCAGFQFVFWYFFEREACRVQTA
jgi:hypothetical protein